VLYAGYRSWDEHSLLLSNTYSEIYKNIFIIRVLIIIPEWIQYRMYLNYIRVHRPRNKDKSKWILENELLFSYLKLKLGLELY